MIGVVRATLLLASLGLASSVLLAAGHNTEAGHNPPVATFAVDVNTAGNVYTADPNADGNFSDNSLAVEVADFCIQVASPGPSPIDIVARNMGQATAYDVRLNFDPSLAAVAAVNHTPFADPQGVAVGFLNLPVDPSSLGRADIFAANNLDTAGTAFLAATHLARRDAFFAPDHPHAASGGEPYSAADPDGVTLVRFTLSLNPEANGKIVNLDLSNQPVPGNDYVSLDPGSAAEETVPVPDSNLIDGAIAVNTACPAPPPGAGPVEPGQTPGPGGTTAPGSTPGGGPDGADGTGTPSPDSASPSPADGTGPGGSDSDDDDDDGGGPLGGGPLGTGSDWEMPLLVAIALIILASAGGAVWWWRRRFR